MFPKEVNHLELHQLSEEISHHYYRKLGLRLGLSEAKLSNIEHDHRPTEAATYAALKEWLKNEQGIQSRRLLADALQKCGLYTLAEKIENGVYLSSASASDQPITDQQIEQVREDLMDFYRARLFHVKTDPLDPNKMVEFDRIFTNLALLGEDVNTKEKTTLLYENLLEIKINGKLPRRLMVQGEAGVGKSTFLTKIVYDWCEGKCFKDFKLVLVVPLRGLEAGVSVGNVVKNYLGSENEVTAEQLDAFIKMNPRQVLLLLDGYDEHPGDVNSEKCGDPVLDILRCKECSKCQVIVTTRKWKVHHIRNNAELRTHYAFIEVEGFKRENVQDYVSRFFKGNEEAATSLGLFLEKDSLVTKHMSPYPIYCAMLCCMWKEDSRREVIKRLQTFSQLFDEMVNFLKDHYLEKHKRMCDIWLSGMRDRLDLCLGQLAVVAYEGLLEKKLCFLEDEFDKCKEAVMIGLEIGVITKEEKIAGRRERKKHCLMSNILFPHKLFQEFLAGLHLVSLFQENKELYNNFFSNNISEGSKEEFTYLLYFAASQDKSVAIDITQRLLQDMETRMSTCSSSLPDTVAVGARPLKLIVDIVLESCEEDVARMVEARFCSLSRMSVLKVDDSMSPHTVAGYFTTFQNMECLMFEGNKFGHTLSRDLAGRVCSLRSLRRLVLSARATFHDGFYQVLCKDAGKSKVERLEMHCFHVDEASASENLARALGGLPALRALKLSVASFHDDFYSTLATLPLKIHELHLSGLHLFSEREASNSAHLASCISSMPNLKKLVLSDGLELHDIFYAVLAESASSIQVEEMELCGVDLKTDETASGLLAESVCAMPCLRSLVVTMETILHPAFYSTMQSKSSIDSGDENAPEGLSMNWTSTTSLTADDTTMRGLCSHSLHALFPGLQCLTVATKAIQSSWLKKLRLPDLQELHIRALLPKRDASISDDEVQHFSHTLIKSFPRLKRLEMFFVALGNQKADMVVSSLKEHPCLGNLVLMQCHTDGLCGTHHVDSAGDRLRVDVEPGKRDLL